MKNQLPICNLITCSYCKNEICMHKNYYDCNYTIAKLLNFKTFCEHNWINHYLPTNKGNYLVLLLDKANDIILETTKYYDGSNFDCEDYCKIIAWKTI